MDLLNHPPPIRFTAEIKKTNSIETEMVSGSSGLPLGFSDFSPGFL
jgi:hypothetical protein